MRIGLISDTHGKVHRDLHEIFQGVEMILHAGDVGGDDVLDELDAIAPVVAIAGNVDTASEKLPLKRIVNTRLGKLGMAHGHEYPSSPHDRAKQLLATFSPNGVRVIVYGHSHIQRMEVIENCHIINPGAASPPRFGKAGSSVAILQWEQDHNEIVVEFFELDWRGGIAGRKIWL